MIVYAKIYRNESRDWDFHFKKRDTVKKLKNDLGIAFMNFVKIKRSYKSLRELKVPNNTLILTLMR
jgi:hypothetical protein